MAASNTKVLCNHGCNGMIMHNNANKILHYYYDSNNFHGQIVYMELKSSVDPMNDTPIEFDLIL